MGEVLEVALQGLAVVPPRLSIHAGRGFLLQTEVGCAQRFQVVDVVEKRREPQLLIPLCCLTYPLQPWARPGPARCPGRVLWRRFLLVSPFPPSPPPPVARLCSGTSPVLRVCPTSRLFIIGVRPQTSRCIPPRHLRLGGREISRFSCEVFPCMRGVSDRVGSQHIWRIGDTWVWPSALGRRRHPQFLEFRGSIPGLHSPVNASAPCHERPPMTRGRYGSLTFTA